MAMPQKRHAVVASTAQAVGQPGRPEAHAMLQFDLRLQKRLPPWLCGRHARFARPLLRTLGRWSRSGGMDAHAGRDTPSARGRSARRSGAAGRHRGQDRGGRRDCRHPIAWRNRRRQADPGRALAGRFAEALHALRRRGTEIIYVPGNHDRPIRKFCGLVLPAMQVRRRAIHVTADGRWRLVTHGDDYDGSPISAACRNASVTGCTTAS